MGHVTFIVGLAGSGKSHLMNSGRFDFACHDGFMAVGAHESAHRNLVRLLRAGKRCAVAELQLMRRYTRDGYLLRLRRAVPGVRVRWVFFENDIAAASHNCRLRRNKPGDPSGKKHVAMNESWTHWYELPARVRPRKIFRARRRK